MSKGLRGSGLLCLRQTICNTHASSARGQNERWLNKNPNIHNPLRSLVFRFGHFLDDEAQKVSGLVVESCSIGPCSNNILSQYMRRPPPPFSMFDMRIYAPFVITDLLRLVDHGCLSYSRSLFIWVIDGGHRKRVLRRLRRRLCR